MSDVVTPGKIAETLASITHQIGEVLDQLRDADLEAARSKAEYDFAYAQAFRQTSGSIEARRHLATETCHGRRLAAEEAACKVRDLKARVRHLETRVDVGRSYGAALRAEMNALPWAEG